MTLTGNQVRRESVWTRFEALKPRTRHQKLLQRTIESVLAMAELWSVAGREEHFETAWEMLELLLEEWDLSLSPPAAAPAPLYISLRG